jgi:hypothetical protein
MNFRVNNKLYDVKELTITEFTNFSSELSQLTDLFDMARCVLSHFTDIPENLISCIANENLAELPIKEIIVLDKKDIDYNFNNLTVGKFIDVEEFLMQSKLQLAIAVLKSEDDYTLENLKKIPAVFADEAISFISAYSEWKISIFAMYDDVITKASTQEDIKKNEDKGNTWLELVHSLADFDATNVKQELIYKRTLTSLLLTLRLKKNATKNT